MARGMSAKDYMEMECIPELLMYLRKEERLSYGSIVRYMYDEGFKISDGVVMKIIKDYLGGDPLGREAWYKPTGPRKKPLKRKNKPNHGDPLDEGHVGCGKRVIHHPSE